MADDTEYQKYLKTDVWKALRNSRLAMDGARCRLCNEPAQAVHHRDYRYPYGTETVDDLTSLCNDCHDRHHLAHPVKHYAVPIPAEVPDNIALLEKRIAAARFNCDVKLAEQLEEQHKRAILFAQKQAKVQ